ncbi:MAG: hypothetical protein AAGB51_04320 [Planctomycetota bacterium]
MRTGLVSLVIFLVAASVAESAQDEGFALRWGETIPGARVVAVSEQGVSVSVDGGVPRRIGWHRIRSLPSSFEAEAVPFESIREDAWRASIRLRRGDYIAAEPLFVSLFQRLAGTDGPGTAHAGAGLARCRLARGAAAEAVAPWTRCVRSTELGQSKLSPDNAASVLAGAPSRLQPGLAPFFAPGQGRGVLAAESVLWPFGTSELVDAYIAAVACDRHERRWHDPGLSDGVLQQERVRSDTDLLIAIAFTRHPDALRRELARAALDRWIETAPDSLEAWAVVWSRVAVGRSLVREDDPSLRAEGVLTLLGVVAAYPDELQRLTALALAEASDTLLSDGDALSAEVLRAELRTRYRGKPAAVGPPDPTLLRYTEEPPP